MTAITEDQARCVSVTSNDGTIRVEGGYYGSGWHVTDVASGRELAWYKPEPGLDAYGVLVRWQARQEELRREKGSE